MFVRILAMTKAVASDRAMLEGFVALFAEVTEKKVLRSLAMSMDVLAYLVHIYLASDSPATEWKEGACTAAVTNKLLPKLPPNIRRSAMASYNLGPLHDHRPLLRVVKAFIRDDDAGALPPLSCRLIR